MTNNTSVTAALTVVEIAGLMCPVLRCEWCRQPILVNEPDGAALAIWTELNGPVALRPQGAM